MSLFQTKDLWFTRCGNDEVFGYNSLVISDLGELYRPKIILASYAGFLRIYGVDREEGADLSFKASDLLLETRANDPILQVEVGHFVSGSKNLQIALLHPMNISVYSFTLIPGCTEHGNQYALKIIYEHPLKHSTYQMVVGEFGGIRGRDFFCVLSLDGMLTFFEQETFVSQLQLPLFLLPSPIAYVPDADTFITMNADWILESYRYQSLAGAYKNVVPIWTYNLGENLTDLKVVMGGGGKKPEYFLMVLSQRNLICLNGIGSAVFSKRLPYSAACFSSYSNEFGDIMTLVCSDAGVLFVYERTKLKWTAKFTDDSIPIFVGRLDLSRVKGTILTLTEDGLLKSSYLGTNPSLFVAPSLSNSIINSKHLAEKLDKLQSQIKNMKLDASKTAISDTDRGVKVHTKVRYDSSAGECKLITELTCETLISEVMVTFDVSPPFKVEPNFETLQTLSEKSTVECTLRLEEHLYDVPISSMIGLSIVSYTSHSMVKVCREEWLIPLSLAWTIRPYEASAESNFHLSLTCDRIPPSMSELFGELVEAEESGSTESICLQSRLDATKKVGIAPSKMGYDVWCDSVSSLHCPLLHLIKFCENNGRKVAFKCQHLPLEHLLRVIDRHANIRMHILQTQDKLDKLSGLYRIIQKRVLQKLRDKTADSLSNVKVLYEDAYARIMETADILSDERRAALKESCELKAVIGLFCRLLLLNPDSTSPADCEAFEKAISFAVASCADVQGWEERAAANLSHLLRTKLAVSSRDRMRPPYSADDTVEAGVLKELVKTVLERVCRGGFKATDKKNNRVSPIMEADEIFESVSTKKQYTTIRSSQPSTTIRSSQPSTTIRSSQPSTTIQSSQPSTTIPSSQPSFPDEDENGGGSIITTVLGNV